MNANQLHIFIILEPGTPEAKTSINIANNMAMRGHRVTIGAPASVKTSLYPFYRLGYAIYKASLSEGQIPGKPRSHKDIVDLYELHPSIQTIPCYLGDNNLKLQKQRQEIIKLAPDVCLFAFSGPASLIASVLMLGSHIPWIYSEAASPIALEKLFWGRKGRLAAMSGADFIHLQLPAYAKNLPNFLKDRVAIIPSSIVLTSTAANQETDKKDILLWYGELVDSISQCRLALGAFERVCKNHPDWAMHIVGTGPDYKALQAHARSLACADRIKFFTDESNMANHYAAAKAFCFSSSSKAAPQNLLQAMAAGLPCVAFADYEGSRDIIQPDVNGLLASQMNIKSMAKALDRLMGSPDLRKQLGNAAKESMAAYAESVVYDKWESLLVQAAAKKGNSVADLFYREPFASLARMSSRARAEWALRDFGKPMPDSFQEKVRRLARSLLLYLRAHAVPRRKKLKP